MNIGHAPAAMPAVPAVVELRALLREKFPEAHAGRGGVGGGDPASGLRLGVRCLDEAGAGPGMLVEVVACGGGAGLVVSGVLGEAARQGRAVALVDGADTFDPQDAGPERCQWLLWVRCRRLDEAVKAADLVARDGNLPVVLLDLQRAHTTGLRRLPGSTWFRLRSVAAASGTLLLALTPEPSAGCADLRVTLDPRPPAHPFERPRDELEAGLRGTITRARGSAGERHHHGQPPAAKRSA